MANSAGMTELEAREREAEEARARLANTLETLAKPETQQAMKAEVLGHVQGYKDELLKHADRYKDELLQKADVYKGEILERAEQYKGEFLSRADEYKTEALERAEAYKDEALQRARDAGRETVQNVVDDLKTRAMNNPVAVALIGAGIGWRLYKHPPVTTLLVGAGAALLMRTPGRPAADDRSSYRDPYRKTQPRGYVPGGVAGYGYPVEESAPGSSTTEQITEAASSMGERAREAATEAGARIGDVAQRAQSTFASAAEGTFDRAGGLARTVRGNPLLLALVGLAAGVAAARAVRATETGDRFIRRGTDRLGQALDAVADVTGSAASTVGDMADAATSRAFGAVGDVTSSGSSPAESSAGPRTAQGKGQRRRGRQAQRVKPPVSRRAGREITEMAERYPLLLSTAGILLGAVAGAALQPTATEDRYVGPASDALKRRAKETVSGGIEEALAAAEQMMSSAEEQAGGGARPESDGPGGGVDRPFGASPAPDPFGGPDRNVVVVERAQDAAEAQATLSGDKRG